MNEYTINVDFKDHLIYGTIDLKLVQNDYNSTKLKFEFDSKYDEYTKTFELIYPNNEILILEIQNNEITLDNVLVQSGNYKFEISCYDSDSKITEYAIGSFPVREKLVNSNDEEIELDDRYPILDQLIEDTNELMNQTDNLDIETNKVDTTTTITITHKDGTTTTTEINDGENGIDYVITQEDYQEIANVVEEDIQPTLDNKVDKVNGKGLSTNDYTTIEKNKLSGLENYNDTEIKSDILDLQNNKANISDLSSVATSGSYNDLSNKPTIPVVPTNVSAFNNDSDYQTGTEVSSSINIHNTSDLAHEDIRTIANEAKTIAQGKARSEVFDTEVDMQTWLSDVVNKNKLAVGDNLYIKETEKPDYWVTEVLEMPNLSGYYYNISMLETEKPDLTNMVTTDTAQTINGNKNFTGNLKKNNVDVATINDIPTKTSDLTNDSGFIDKDVDDLTNYVKPTDYPSFTNAGVIKINSSGTFGIWVDSNGLAYITSASTADINARTSNYRPIVPSKLDYAVRSVRPINKTVLDTTCEVNTIYTLGSQSTVSIVLPATAQIGDNIEVQFVSGTTATTLTITSSAGLLNSDIVPEMNTQYCLIASWESIGASTYGWKIYNSSVELEG